MYIGKKGERWGAHRGNIGNCLTAMRFCSFLQINELVLPSLLCIKPVVCVAKASVFNLCF